MDIPEKYEPLFKLLYPDEFPEFINVDTVILTGGRGSGKSDAVARFALNALVDHDYKTVYTRFTNASIQSSIKDEVSSKIELFNYENLVVDNKKTISTLDSSIEFKGLKTGSKSQTANTKSLSGFNCWVLDEAEEAPSYKEWERAYLSIRSVIKRNLSIMILNPALKALWIYQHFFKGKVEDGFNGVCGNVLYIHTSYLDIPALFLPKNIVNYYNRLKIEDPREYRNIVLGGWLDRPEGVLFNEKFLKFHSFKNIPEGANIYGAIDIADAGEDNHCLIIAFIFNEEMYIHDVLFTKENTDVNIPLTAEMINLYKPLYVRLEINFGGRLYGSQLKKLTNENTQILPINNSASKHSRILNALPFFSKCYFNENLKGSLFLEELLSYKKDGTSAHDDAPDNFANLCVLVNSAHQII